MQKWVIGVDEAGRGPLAGPVAVGVALVPVDFSWDLLPGVTDSKVLTHERRVTIAEAAKVLKKSGQLDFQVALVGPGYIDARGIVLAVRKGMQRTLGAVTTRNGVVHEEVHVRLDGSLHAPPSFMHQETIIKGDAKEKCIGLASILAKVARDRYMVRIAAKYPLYGFEVHKGYGTKAHRACILEHGLSTLHRTTFCRNLIV